MPTLSPRPAPKAMPRTTTVSCQSCRPKSKSSMFGDAPTAADVCLVPQLYNARRYNVPLSDYPILLRAEENANKLEGFAAAHPDRQEQPQ